MTGRMKIPQDRVAAGGLALGGIFGLVGTIVTDQSWRAASWAIDSVGLVVATVLLTLMYFRKGNDVVAAGFLVFAIGEGVMLSGTAATLQRSVPAFGPAQPCGPPPCYSRACPRNSPAGFASPGSLAQFSLLLRRGEFFGGNTYCPRPNRCRSWRILSSYSPSAAGFGHC